MATRKSSAGVGPDRIVLNLLVVCSLLLSSVSLSVAASPSPPTPRAAAGPPAARHPEFDPWPAVAAGNLLTPTATATLTPTVTLTPTLTATAMPTALPPVVTPTLTATPSPTPTLTPTATMIPTVPPTVTLTPTPTATATPTPALTVTPTPTLTPPPTFTPTPTPSPTPPPQPSLSLAMTIEPATAAPGQVVSVTLVLSNTGTGPAQGLVLTDVLPAGLGYVPDSAPGANYDPTANRLTWQVRGLAAGQALTLSFAARVTAQPGETLVNFATLAGSNLPQPLAARATVYVAAPGLVRPDVGGVLRSADGRVAVRFPPGSVTRPVEAQHRPLAPLDLAPDHHIFYRFELTAWEAGQPNVPAPPFARPVTVTLVYSDTDVDGLLEAGLRLVTRDEATGAWTPVTATVNVTANQITAQLAHFSEYGIEGEDDLFFLPRLEAGQVSLFSGDSSFSYALDVPAGAGGLRLPLTLRYSSGTPNGMKHGPYGDDNSDTGWVGVGWTFDVGKIEDGALTMNGLSGDLKMVDTTISEQYTTECDWDGTHCSPGLRVRRQYRLSDEEFARIEADRFSSCTEENAATCCNGRPNCPAAENNQIRNMGTIDLWTKDGTHYVFGSQPYSSETGYGSRLDVTASNWSRVYEAYLLDAIIDPHGNRLDIQWQVFPKTIEGRVHLKEAYPAHILYTTNSGDSLAEYDVEFVVVAKDHDIQADKRLAATGYQLSAVKVWYQAYAGAPQQLIRRYEFVYDDYDSPQFYTLRRIRQYDAGGASLPETVFTYYYDTSHQIGWKTDDGWEHTVQRPFLDTVDNGYGGVLSFDYHDYCLPEGHGCAGGSVGWGMRQRVSSRTLSAGIGPAMLAEYSYADPGYQWDPADPLNPLEQFIGFGQAVEETKGTGGQTLQRTVTEFHNTMFWRNGYWRGAPHDPLKGKVLQTEVGQWNDGAADWDYHIETVHSYTTYTDTVEAGWLEGVTFVYVSQVVEKTCAGEDPCQSKKTIYDYNSEFQAYFCGAAVQLGNLTHVYEYDDEEAEDPYRTTVTSYCPNLTDWIVDRATTSNVYAGDVGGTLESSTHYIYGQDGQGPLWTLPPNSQGELRGVRRYAGPNQFVDTRYTYDSFGNVTEQTVYNSYGTGTTWASTEARTTTTEYDDTHYTFPGGDPATVGRRRAVDRETGVLPGERVRRRGQRACRAR